MASAIQKITLSVSRDIPFNKLALSQANVRRVKAGVAIEELATDIGRRTLLQSLTVRPVVDAEGVETGTYEVPAGGRRFRALELLVRQKRLAKTAPIPCVIRTEGIAEEDSLAENVQRAPRHPLDQFRAFLTLREKGQSEEEIAANFFVSVAVVKQRLRLAAVSPRLLDIYAEDGMTLDQLMAFTVSADHERQEQVWERLQSAYSREPFAIRRLLTGGAVRASDKRARFIGEAYEAAGGAIMRDLFQGDDGGWLQHVALVARLVAERLDREADAIRAEGWRSIEVALDFPYGYNFGLRQIRGEQVPLTAEEEATRQALRAEYDALEEQHPDQDEIPECVEQRFTEIEQTLGGMDLRSLAFDAAEVARAGAFVSIDSDGERRVERGYVRPEDELPVPAEPEAEMARDGEADDGDSGAWPIRLASGGETVHDEPEQQAEPEEDEGMKPIPDRLMSELTAHRTLALCLALGEHRDVACPAALHALCLRLFYQYGLDTCLDLDVKSVSFHAQAPGLNDTMLARTLLTLGEATAAMEHFRAMLKLDPNDNQGIRYLLLGSLLQHEDVPALKALLADYPDEWTTYWLSTRALIAYRENKRSAPATLTLLKDARSTNQHVPAILAGTRPATPSDSFYVTVGGADEANDYVRECGAAWRNTAGGRRMARRHFHTPNHATNQTGRPTTAPMNHSGCRSAMVRSAP